MPILNMIYWVTWWGGWWTPWVNTLAYYTFDTQILLNEATNTVDATWYSWQWSYDTGYWWTGYCVDIATWWAIALSTHIPQWDFTVAFCVKFNSYPPTWDIWWLFGYEGALQYGMHCQMTGDIREFVQYTNSYNGTSLIDSNTLSLNANTWYRFYITRNSWTVKMYINGSVVGTWIDNNPNATSQTRTCYLWTTYNISERKLNGYLDNVIIENRAWTDAEIINYDNNISA